MKVLSVDYGSKRIGLALGDENLKLAVPIGWIANTPSALETIVKTVRERGVVKLIIGLPLTLRGKEGQRAKEVRKFVSKLEESLGEDVEIVLWDERFTTEEAYRQLEGYPQRKKKELKDSLSALIILQEYMESL